MLGDMFQVAAEFRFDVGEALLNTKALQGAVDNLSNSANSALNSLGFLASGLVTRLGLGSGGLLTFLTRAVTLAEEFDQTSLGFANNITANMSKLTGTIETFNDRLDTSRVIMDDISKTAVKFALPTNELARVTNLLSQPLIQHGRAGRNFGGAIEMSKNLMLASDMLQMPQGMAAESVYRALTDGLPLQGKMFARLANTQTFKGAKILHQQQLSGMAPDKKIDLLNKALKDLAMDSDALNYRLRSLHGQFTIFQDMFMQIGSFLEPVGEAIREPLVKILTGVNSYLQRNGAAIGHNLAKVIGNVLADPMGLAVNLMQLSRFKKDFKDAINITSLLFFVTGISSFFKVMKPFTAAMEGMLGISRGAGFLQILLSEASILGKVFGVLRMALADFIPVTAAFMFLFQVISRARSIAKINDAIAWVELGPKLLEIFARMKTALENILMPITMAIDGLARMIAPIFETTILINALSDALSAFATVMDFVGKVVIYVLAALSGIVNMLIGFVDDIIHLNNPFENMLSNLKDGFNDFLKDNEARLGGEKIKATSNFVTNINTVNINNAFKENQQPDRVAFSLKEQLLKAAKNPTQARGVSQQGAFAR